MHLLDISEATQRQRTFRNAARVGCTEFVRTGCKQVPQDTIDRAIQLAARNGHLDCLKLLTRHTDTPPNFALVQAARRGHTWCVKHLLKTANAEYSNGWAIRLAAKYGFDRCVNVLFEPSQKCIHAHDNEAYRNALRSTNIKSINRLGNLGPNHILIINEEMPAHWKTKLFSAVNNNNLHKAIDIITLCYPTVEKDIDICLCMCVIFNYQTCAQFFIKHGADHTRNRHNCLRQAAIHNHRSMFHYIWSLGTPTLSKDPRLIYACFKNKWWDEVQMLFETVQCPDLRNQHLICAAHLGCVEWVVKFLAVADPKHYNSCALQYTCFSKNQDIFDILYDVSDVAAALEQICDSIHSHFYKDRGWFISQMQRRENQQQNKILSEAVVATGAVTSRRKM